MLRYLTNSMWGSNANCSKPAVRSCLVSKFVSASVRLCNLVQQLWTVCRSSLASLCSLHCEWWALTLRLIDASFDDVDGAVELVTSLADPFLDKYISDHFGTYHEAGAVLARAIASLEGRTAAMRRRTAATTGPAVFEHFARLAQDAPALPHPALAGDVASAWVKQTAWRTARQRAIAAADSATARADVETAEHRKWADAVAGIIIDAALPAATDASVLRDPQRALRRACGSRRATTLRMRVRHWVRFRTWVVAVTGRSWPSHPSLIIEYLEELADDIACGVSLPSQLLTALNFFEKVGGVPVASRTRLSRARSLLSPRSCRYHSHLPGRPRRSSFSVIIALEHFVVSTAPLRGSASSRSGHRCGRTTSPASTSTPLSWTRQASRRLSRAPRCPGRDVRYDGSPSSSLSTPSLLTPTGSRLASFSGRRPRSGLSETTLYQDHPQISSPWSSVWPTRRRWRPTATLSLLAFVALLMFMVAMLLFSITVLMHSGRATPRGRGSRRRPRTWDTRVRTLIFWVDGGSLGC